MIEVKDLHKSFGKLHVLKGIDFTAEQGEVVVIIGPSGMGKSTFLRCLNCIEFPEQGSIEIDGVILNVQKKNEKQIRALRQKSSMVFQNYNVFKNKTVLQNVMLPMTSVQKMKKEEAKESKEVAGAALESEEYGYCTEFIIRLSESAQRTFEEETLRDSLARIGNSIVCVRDDDIVKVHVHTLTPGDALNMGLRYGSFAKLKVENMQEQHEEIMMNASVEKEVKEEKPRQKYAIITVAAGDGLKDMFKELRADYVISGGQTMNPSTEDFVEAIHQLNAEHIIILPNNSNIVMAAQQAALVCEDQNIEVIPTKSIPQGLSACIMFNPDVDFETNLSEMKEAVSMVKTGQVTYAIKDTTFEGMEIKSGDYMGILEKDIIVSLQDKMETTRQLLDRMLDDESEIVTLIYGEDINEEEAEEVAAYIEDKYDVEVEVNNGMQPVYSFIIGVE